MSQTWAKMNKKSLKWEKVLDLLEKLNFSAKPEFIKTVVQVKKKKKKIYFFLKNFFQKVDKDGNKRLDFEEFLELLNLLRARPEIENLFLQYKHPAFSYMTLDDFIRFLQIEQGVKKKKILFFCFIFFFNFYFFFSPSI